MAAHAARSEQDATGHHTPNTSPRCTTLHTPQTPQCCCSFVTGETLVVDGGAWLHRPQLVAREMVTAVSRRVESGSRAVGVAGGGGGGGSAGGGSGSGGARSKL